MILFDLETEQFKQTVSRYEQAAAKRDCWELAACGGAVGHAATHAKQLGSVRNADRRGSSLSSTAFFAAICPPRAQRFALSQPYKRTGADSRTFPTG